jgi:HEPN domain-containing protein
MTPRTERFYKREYASELLRIAEGDLASAIGLRKIAEGRPENVCYHAQQCVEKAIKAVFCGKGLAVPLVHDLDLLVAKLPQELQPPSYAVLSELSLFASVRRYEEGVAILSEEDLDSALAVAQAHLVWARQMLEMGN